MTADVVIPTVGRPSLARLLAALAAEPPPGRVIVVHDGEPDASLPAEPGLSYNVVEGPRRGPAAARNTGRRAARAEWIAFLDDDVVPEPGWAARLLEDLRGLAPGVAGSQGRIVVPLPHDRAPTDWERNVAGLETARWATADMAYRRSVLDELGGFDERFPRAYREDADLALRAERAGYRLVRGRRTVTHPVRPASRWISLRLQAGNADDPLMASLHGRRWREERPPGRRPRHFAVTAAGLVALVALAAGRRRLAAAGLAAWLAGTAEFAWARIAPGPRTREEVGTMIATSAALPVVATAYWLFGIARLPSLHVQAGPSPQAAAAQNGLPDAVLLDRDGTLVVDVPYNGDPRLVEPMPGAREALDRLRAAGIPLGVVSNQSGVGRGLLTLEQVEAVNRRVEQLLGPVDCWAVCPHAPDEGCDCRKPRDGLVRRAARELGADPARCVLLGDIGADVEAARAAGARAVLVPTALTRREEVERAPEVAATLAEAVELVLGGAR